MIGRPPSSTPFPYPALSRSAGQPGAAGQPQVPRGARAAQVAVDEQDPPPRLGQRQGQVAGGGGLTLLRETAGDHQDLGGSVQDRKSTRLHSSHLVISYAVFC